MRRTIFRPIVDTMLEEGNSRYPVFRETIDNIVGIIHYKDALKFLTRNSWAKFKPLKDLPGLIREASFIPETRGISDLFKSMQMKKIHMAVVVDEYGQTSGIVSMEDILEELVGEIYDESDEIPEGITRVNDNCFETAGEVDLDDLFEEIGYTLPNFDSDYHSVSGWVLEELEHIPEPMESFVRGRLKVTVLQVEEQRIGRIRLEILPEQPDGD